MPIQIVHTGERIPVEELLASHRDPLVLEYISRLRSVGFAEKTLRNKRTIIAAFLRWARNRRVPSNELGTMDLDAFLGGHRPGRNSRWRHARGILFGFLAFLRPDGPWPGSLDPLEDSSRTGFLARYQDFLVNGRGLAERAGSLLEAIVPSIQKTSDLVQEISAASAEQNSGVGQINNAINLISQAVQQNAAASEELASTSEEMRAQAQGLQSMMAFFTIAGGQDQRGSMGLKPAAPMRGKVLPVVQRTPGKVQKADFTQF
jgi:hypothetical protein